MSNKIKGEISDSNLERLIRAVSNVSTIENSNNVILIHGTGGQDKSFYNDLRQDKDVKVLWSGFSIRSWWGFFLRFIPGEAGIVKVLNINRLADIYFEIGAQSFCGLYFVPADKLPNILQRVSSGNLNFDFDRDMDLGGNYFIISVDFDYHGDEKDGGTYYWEVSLGASLDEAIRIIITGNL